MENLVRLPHQPPGCLITPPIHPACPRPCLPACLAAEESWVQTMATDVAVGDTVWTVSADGKSATPAKVANITQSTEQGMFAPFIRVRCGRVDGWFWPRGRCRRLARFDAQAGGAGTWQDRNVIGPC